MIDCIFKSELLTLSRLPKRPSFLPIKLMGMLLAKFFLFFSSFFLYRIRGSNVWIGSSSGMFLLALGLNSYFFSHMPLSGDYFYYSDFPY